MARRSNVEILIEVLKQQDKNQGSPRALGKILGWEPEKILSTARRPEAAELRLSVGKGGVIKYRGSENHSNGLYAEVARVIERYWGPRELGLRNITTILTAQAGTRGQGAWTHPDLVIVADPKRRDSQTEPPRLHAVEIETKKGFDLRSVYQAHAQGRGANYSWVFGNLEPHVATKDWDRIVWTATDLGVGLVTFGSAGSWGTWRTWNKATLKSTDPKARDEFLTLALGPRLRAQHEL